mgnify:CR=1 FL=1
MAKAVARLGRVLQDVATALGSTSVKPAFAVVGGLAVSARVEPRFTRDVDLAVATSGDVEAEAVVHQLRGVGYRVLQAFEHDSGRMATVRLLPRGGRADQVVVDLLFASSGIEPEVVQHADVIEVLPGISLPVASIGHLIALKLLSVEDRRPNDLADLVALAGAADDVQWSTAREAAKVLTARGFHRSRDLLAALADLAARFRTVQ